MTEPLCRNHVNKLLFSQDSNTQFFRFGKFASSFFAADKVIGFLRYGTSGSGKSTIAKLPAGYWDAQDGEILIGRRAVSDFSQEALNRLIAYVDQDTFLFDKSIMENIRMGNSDATDEQVMDAAKNCHCPDHDEGCSNHDSG